MQSETIGKLADALAKAQAEIKAPTKGKTARIPGRDGRAGYEYRYADLADVIDCYREPLTKQGLALAQTMRYQDGHLVLVTKLMHSSGEWIDSEYPIAAYAKPQEQGSAITYARRYNVTAILGIAAEDDDDGAAAQDGKPTAKPAAAKPEPAPAKPANGLTREDIESVHAAAKRAGIKNPTELAPVLQNIVGVAKASEIPRGELGNVLDALQSMEERQVRREVVDELAGAGRA
jgi:hypothetical protein